jgi:hypothetical protein
MQFPLSTQKASKTIANKEKQYLFWFENKLSPANGEGNVRHGCKPAAVHR